MQVITLGTSYTHLDSTPGLEGFSGILMNLGGASVTVTPSTDGTTAGTTVSVGAGAAVNLAPLPAYIKASAATLLLV